MIGKVIRHTLIVLTGIFVILGLPLMRSEAFSAWIHGTEVDATSSASVILDQPSGEYVVLLNRERHTPELLLTWRDFFEGREVDVILEDIRCSVAKTDSQGIEMAKSFQSRLPENQMDLQREDGVLLLSKAQAGRFDVILLSREMADAYQAQTLEQSENIEWITGSKG